jgi:hypothetical protein
VLFDIDKGSDEFIAEVALNMPGDPRAVDSFFCKL